MAFSDDDDEFDDISLPDLEMVDLTVYDTPTQPMSRSGITALSRTPSMVLSSSKSKSCVKTEPADASEWDIPIRIDSNGEYIQGSPLPPASQVAFPKLPQSSISKPQSNHNGHTSTVPRQPAVPIKKTQSNPTPQSRFPPQPFVVSSIQNGHFRAVSNPPIHPNPRPPSRLRSNEIISPSEGVNETAKLTDEAAGRELREIQRKNEELNRILKEQAQALLTAKGETSNLRRSLKDTETKAAQNLAAITAQHAAELEKRNRRDEERRLEEEGRRAKSIFDNHNAATYSARRPQWSTQSSIPRSQSRAPPPFGDFQPSSQTNRGGGAGHNTSMVSRVDTGAGEGGSQSFARGSSSNRESETVSPGRDFRVKEEKKAMLPPPPKFRGLKNTFNPSKSLGMRQPSFSQDRPPPPMSQSSRTFRVPFKNPPSLSQQVDGPMAPSSSPESMIYQTEQERGTKRRRVNDSAIREGATDEKEEMMTETTVKGQIQGEAGEVVDHPDASGQTVVDEIEEENQDIEQDNLGMQDLVLEDEDEAEDLFWRSQEKNILFSVVFTDQVSPSSTLPSPSTSLSTTAPLTPSSPYTRSPASISTIQQILAPLPTESSSFRDRADHSNACARILNALGGASFSGLGADPLNEVIRGLNAAAKVFERLNMVSTLTVTLKLIHCILLHIPRASRILLHLPSFLSLITSIKNTYLPFPVKPPSFPSSRPPLLPHSQALPNTALVASPPSLTSTKQEHEKYAERTAVVMRLLYVIESCAWEADSGSDSDVLSRIIQLPRFTSALLDPSVPIRIVLQTIRIINYLCFDELLFRPLLSYPDHAVEQPPPTRDPTRIPLVEQLCKLAREPPISASSGEVLLLSLETSSFFRVLCEKHEDEAIIMFGQSRSLIPTLIVCLERDSSIIWGIDPSSSQLQQSIPSLFPMLSLLYSLTVPVGSLDDPGTPTVNLTDKLRQAPRREFNALFEKFMVAFGRICYADAPEVEDILERAGSEEERGEFEDEDDGQEDVDARRSEKADRLVVELERAGEIARDIFDQVVEGPEGDLVYDVFSDQRPLDDVPLEEGQHQEQEDPEGFGYPDHHARLDFPSSSVPPEEAEAVQISHEVVTEDQILNGKRTPRSSSTRSGAIMTRTAAAAAAAAAQVERRKNTDQMMVPDSDDELTEEEGDDEIQVLS
ncbi:hypothetical protein [Phaffia rhodozyma]|uniref:Uncharacterized protein n=1 Tax=Phaffia rhodozyma TaxID=264483 RepID=A0A0F7SSN6_PHARH|nr:hypothetical protein [Phaffia rhodozyma]